MRLGVIVIQALALAGYVQAFSPIDKAVTRTAGKAKRTTKVRLEAVDEIVQAANSMAPYEPGPNEVTQAQLWVGFIAGLFPFFWAAVEFYKRIDTQK